MVFGSGGPAILMKVVVTGSAVAFAVSRSGDSAVRCPAGYGYAYGVNVRGHCTPPTTDDDAVTGDRFVGHWSVHGSQLEIRPNGTGTIESNCGGAFASRMTRYRSFVP
jgi:hypothetical protein